MEEDTMDHNTFAWRTKTPTFFHLGNYARKFVRPIDLKNIEDREHATLLETFRQILKTEPKIFRQNRVYNNVLCYLLLREYWKNDDDDILDEFHERISSEHNGNLMTLQLKIEACKNTALAKREGLIQELNENCGDESQSLAAAEVAFYLSRLDHRLYYPAIELLEANLPNLPQDDMIFWKYELGKMYNRILNKDFWRSVDNLSLRKVFRRLYELLLDVCRSEDMLRGRAMVDLADAIDKAISLDKCTDIPEKIEVHTVCDLSPGKLRSEAYQFDPSDPHIKERYARAKRKSKEIPIEEAIAMFKEVTDKHKHRHVALHQQAIACRSLWIEINNLKPKPKRNRRPKKNRGDAYSRLAETFSDQTHFDVKTLQAYNPVMTAETKRDELLEQARDCLKRANKIMKNRSAIYQIDLAKVYMSLGEVGEAEECLDKACREEFSTRISDLDRAVLYEQLGICYYLKLETREENHNSSAAQGSASSAAPAPSSSSSAYRSRPEIQQYLRRAIELTNATRRKPVDAFQLLRAMLSADFSAATSDREQTDLKLELESITTCMGYLNISKRVLLEIPESAEKSKRLVQLLAKQGKYSAAYTELFTGCTSGVFCVRENAKRLVEIGAKAAREREREARERESEAGEREREAGDDGGALMIYYHVFKLLLEKTANCVGACCNGTADHTATNGTVANDTASNSTAANGTASDCTAAKDTASDCTAAKDTASDCTVANGTASDCTAAKDTASDCTIANGTASDCTMANGTASDCNISNGTDADITNSTPTNSVVPHNDFVIITDNGDCPTVEALDVVLRDQCKFKVYVLSDEGYDDIPLGANIVSEPIEAIMHGDVVLVYMPNRREKAKRWVDTAIANSATQNRLLLIRDGATQYPPEWAAISSVTIPKLLTDAEDNAVMQGPSPHDILPVLLEAIVEKIL